MSLLGLPFGRYIDIDDSEQLLRAIRLTPPEMPIDLLLHTPGGLVLASDQIAYALKRHDGKVTVIVPHYAMSGGTLVALAADEILMDPDAVLGPVDPQLGSLPRGSWPAASILKALEQDNPNRDDETLILGDVARKAIDQVRATVRELLDGRVPRRGGGPARGPAQRGPLDARLPDPAGGGRAARAARLRRRARARLRADDAVPAAQPAAAVGRVHPDAVPARADDDVSAVSRPGPPVDDDARPGATCRRRGTAARTWSADAWTGRTSRTGSRRIRTRARVTLPDLALDDSGLFDALARRRSVRAYGPEPLALGELGALLWAAAGVTARQDGFAFRTAPSAGGLYPIEHYVVANDVEGLEQGLYHYDVLGRALERLHAGDLRLPVARAALDQRIAAEAQAVFVWTAVLERSRWKYGERFVRYVLLDAGHIAENVALAATALGLGTCQIAAFFDEEAADILGVDPDVEPVVYMSTAGRPAGRRRPGRPARSADGAASPAAGSGPALRQALGKPGRDVGEDLLAARPR